MTGRYDVAVVGSGFAGSLMAMVAQRLGLRVILLERGTHPRMAIGESSTPLSNLLLEELATRYNLPSILPLCKWGSWRKTHPELACGLKRGFTFFHHTPGAGAASLADRANQLFVAASPHNDIGDTHWYRADFDHFLVREAGQQGIEYLDEVDLHDFRDSGDEIRLKGNRRDASIEVSAQFVIDATGPRGFLHRALNLGDLPLPDLPPTQAIYSHFSGVKPTDCRLADTPPYPLDDAAVHHIFDGGWVWVLRFSNGITSAGLAATDGFMAQLDTADPQTAWQQVLRKFPALHAQFADAQPVQPFRYIPRLSFRSAAVAGPNWALLPSAAGFVDPLLSTGFPLALLGISRLATVIERGWDSPAFTAQLESYAAQTDAELLATSRLIAALYANMASFTVFSALTLLYFTTASYSETAHRLGKPHLATGFLLHDHQQFGPASQQLIERAAHGVPARESEAFIRDVHRAIAPFDVAGLTRLDRRNWYPVDTDDLFRSASRLGATREEISQMLERCGFCQPTSSA
ncbi:MAG TPA: FAD-dependent oxidoreductase [Acidobacteriaceae bacterium]|nr:FAD-dependent oxidoreductase [Acidobacteriaceae bacterium]